MSSAQKLIKYLAVAFAISLIVSIFMGIYQAIGAASGVFINGTGGNGLNINDYPNTSNILSVDIRASKLKIVEGEHLKVESDNKYISSFQDYNKLAVTEKNKSIFKTKGEKEVIIYVPKYMIFDKVYISNGAGTINIENITAKDLELEIGAGKLEIDKITTFTNTEIDGGAGEVIIKKANISNLDLDAGVGKFTLNASIRGKSKIDAGVGELNINLLGNKDNYSIYAETGIGSITIDEDSVKDEFTYGTGNNKIDIDGGIGSINIRFLEKMGN